MALAARVNQDPDPKMISSTVQLTRLELLPMTGFGLRGHSSACFRLA